MKVYNHDIYSLVKRLRRFKFELHKSVSSNVSELSGHDLTRLVSYLDALKAFKSWMQSQPLLDLPESSPMEMELGETPVHSEIENDDGAMILKLLDILESEMGNSQSARRATGLIDHDAIRFDSLILKVEHFLNDYVSIANPLDLPESSPLTNMSGSGRVGV